MPKKSEVIHIDFNIPYNNVDKVKKILSVYDELLVEPYQNAYDILPYNDKQEGFKKIQKEFENKENTNLKLKEIYTEIKF